MRIMRHVLVRRLVFVGAAAAIVAAVAFAFLRAG